MSLIKHFSCLALLRGTCTLVVACLPAIAVLLGSAPGPAFARLPPATATDPVLSAKPTVVMPLIAVPSGSITRVVSPPPKFTPVLQLSAYPVLPSAAQDTVMILHFERMLGPPHQVAWAMAAYRLLPKGRAEVMPGMLIGFNARVPPLSLTMPATGSVLAYTCDRDARTSLDDLQAMAVAEGYTANLLLGDLRDARGQPAQVDRLLLTKGGDYLMVKIDRQAQPESAACVDSRGYGMRLPDMASLVRIFGGDVKAPKRIRPVKARAVRKPRPVPAHLPVEAFDPNPGMPLPSAGH